MPMWTALFGTQDELVAVGVFEDRRGAPGLYLRGLDKFDASGDVVFVGFLHIVGQERDTSEGADAVLLAGRGEEHDAGLGTGDAEFDPTLLVAERLVGEDDESEFLGVEIERCVLIADRNRSEF